MRGEREKENKIKVLLLIFFLCENCYITWASKSKKKEKKTNKISIDDAILVCEWVGVCVFVFVCDGF